MWPSMENVDMKIKVPITILSSSCLSPLCNIHLWPWCMFSEGCAFNHDPTKFSAMHQTDRFGPPESTALFSVGEVSWVIASIRWLTYMGSSSNSSSKKGLNVDSPSFTPSLLSTNDTSSKKTTTISPKAASAAPFLPKSVTSRMRVLLWPCRQGVVC